MYGRALGPFLDRFEVYSGTTRLSITRYFHTNLPFASRTYNILIFLRRELVLFIGPPPTAGRDTKQLRTCFLYQTIIHYFHCKFYCKMLK